MAVLVIDELGHDATHKIPIICCISGLPSMSRHPWPTLMTPVRWVSSTATDLHQAGTPFVSFRDRRSPF